MTDAEQKKISNNLNNLIAASNKTQKEIAASIRVSPQTFNTWCQGIAIPRMGKVQALADYFSVGKTDLIDNRSSTSITHRGISINVLGRVAAGIPEEIPAEMAKTGTFFGLQIHGDSMEPRMCDGDVVIVRQQDDAESGDIVIAMINGDDATCKRLRKYRDGIELISNNPAYQPMFFSNDEIQSKPVKIIGKVVELRGKF